MAAAVPVVASAAAVPVVPQGGNTSMVGGAMPDESGRQVVIVRDDHEWNAVRVAHAYEQVWTKEGSPLITSGTPGARCAKKRAFVRRYD